jgi:hypothetical protein
MKRIFIGLTLLLMSFLSTLETLEGLRALSARVAGQRWVPELVLAALSVGVFLYASSLHRRLLFPRRGLRLLAAGIVLYALAVTLATGLLVTGMGMIPLEKGSFWADLPEIAASLYPLPLFLIAQVLLVVGAFRALSNLVPPAEFAEDF